MKKIICLFMLFAFILVGCNEPEQSSSKSSVSKESSSVSELQPVSSEVESSSKPIESVSASSTIEFVPEVEYTEYKIFNLTLTYDSAYTMNYNGDFHLMNVENSVLSIQTIDSWKSFDVSISDKDALTKVQHAQFSTWNSFEQQNPFTKFTVIDGFPAIYSLFTIDLDGKDMMVSIVTFDDGEKTYSLTYLSAVGDEEAFAFFTNIISKIRVGDGH